MTAPAQESIVPQVQQEVVAQSHTKYPQAEAERVLTLPVRYQVPEYKIPIDTVETMVDEQELRIKVGASIRSTSGPQPLWDIMKRLASLKNMNVSWASDVDRDVLVDVHIGANDDFFEAVDNLLRQVDYFHEVRGNTLIIRYKETRRFHIAMPFTKQSYTTGTGGNVLGGDDLSGNIDGTIELKSSDNEFDLWKNIQTNMDAIIGTWNTSTTSSIEEEGAVKGEKTDNKETDDDVAVATRRISSGGSMYIIDKPIGMVTVTAPRPLLDELEKYFNALRQQLYKQINIEAKIIEVQLNSSSSVGIDWSSVLDGFSISGTVEFGNDSGQIYPDDGGFVSTISLDSQEFGIFLHALEEQGTTKVLSNPKIRVMNGQPALISVGQNVTYVDSIDSDVDSDTGVTTYTVETERILSGVGMALTATVLEDDQIIMNLVPVTSELEEPIDYLTVGTEGAQVGLPVVNVREMSTTVRMHDGEILVIGGLISNTNDSTEEFAPILGDIPVVKYLFGYEEKSSDKRELIILLKAKISH